MRPNEKGPRRAGDPSAASKTVSPHSTSVTTALSTYAACVWDADDTIEVRCLRGKQAQSRWVETAALPTEADRLSKLNADGWQIYGGLNPRSCRGDGSTAAGCDGHRCGKCAKCVAIARCLLADLDHCTLAEAQYRLDQSGLPVPTLTHATGGGVHFVWRLTEPIRDLARWTRLQQGLANKLDGDPAIHDAPRIIRLPGFVNHKYPHKPIATIVDSEPERWYDIIEFSDCESPASATSESTSVGLRAYENADHRPDANLIASECGWMRHCCGDASTLAEPSWYLALGILGLCHNGRTTAHEWSRPHPDYDSTAVDAKLLHALSDGGPATCRTIADKCGDEWCEGCVHRGRVRSPIVLGRPQREDAAKRDVIATDTEPTLVRLSTVEPEEVSWLWPGRFPLGKLSLVVGDPCVGKSFALCDIASRVTTGTAWPDLRGEVVEPGTVVMLTAEDGLADTIRPRIDRLAGDPSRIHVLTGIPEPGQSDRMFSLARDLGALECAITTTGARLVVIDPLSAYLGGADSHRDAEVRSVLAPLAALAEKHRTAIIGIMHLGKDSGRRAAYRTNGSIAFTAAPRAVWAIAEDREKQGRRIMVCVKLNVAEAADGIGYRITDGAVAWDSEPISMTADQALGNPPADGDGAGSEAETFLRDALADGPVRASEIRRLARDAGIAKRTLERAKDRLGVRSNRVGFAGVGQWLWALPNSAGPSKDATDPSKDAIGRHTGEWRPMATYGRSAEIPPPTPLPSGTDLPFEGEV